MTQSLPMRLIQSAILIFTGLSLSAQTPFSIRDNPAFPEPERRLTELVQQRGRTVHNHFEIIGYRQDDGSELAWVHWKENRALILWEAVADPSFALPLAASRRYLKLRHDVVPNEAQLRGSTYLVTQAWVNGVLTDAKSHGDAYEIVRKPHKKK